MKGAREMTTNPYADMGGAVEAIARQLGGSDWEIGSVYELAARRLTDKDREHLRKAHLLAELSAEYLQRIELRGRLKSGDCSECGARDGESCQLGCTVRYGG